MRLKNLVGRLLPCLVAAGATLLMTALVGAQDLLPTVNWSADSGSWNTGSNWSVQVAPEDPAESRVPEEGDVASFRNGGTATISDAVPTVQAVGVSSGTVVLAEGGSLSVAGQTVVDVAGTISFAGGTLETGSFGVSGTIDLSSAIAGDLSLGTQIPIVTAGSVGGTPSGFTIDGSAPNLGRGVGLEMITTDTGAALEVSSIPVLTVDRLTGNVAINNFSDGALQFDGYEMRSEAGHFEARFSAIEDREDVYPGWLDVTPTRQRKALKAEYTFGEPITLGANESVAFDGLMDMDLFEGLTPAEESVTFSYMDGEGVVRPGIVEFLGPVNDLVLRIDPDTGAANIENLSQFTGDFDLTGLTIASENGSLNADGFAALGEGWDIANPNANFLTQVNLLDSVLFDEGSTASLGEIFAGGAQDLTFRYALSNGQRGNGSVVYGAGAPPVDMCMPANELLGDLNGDGMVDFPDFLTLSSNFNQETDSYADGDINCDGTVGFTDFLALSGNFGMSLGATAAQSVPEPSSVMLVFLGVLGMLNFRKRSRHAVCAMAVCCMVAAGAQESQAQLSAQFIRLHPESPNSAINNVLEAKQIFDGFAHDVILNEDITGEYELIDIGGGDGSFGLDFQSPYLNGVTDTSMSNMAMRLTGTITFDAGDYSIGCGSDDGCLITMPGVSFVETFNENGPAEDDDGQLIYNGGRGASTDGTGFTFGNFTIPEDNFTSGIEIIWYEGGGGDSLEVAIFDDYALEDELWGLQGVGIELETDAYPGLVLTPGPFMGGSPADFDGNGTVDADDAEILEDNYNTNAGPLGGDMNSDGIVDLRDVALFKPIFQAANAGAAASVPEPSSALMVVLGSLGLLSVRRRRS